MIYNNEKEFRNYDVPTVTRPVRFDISGNIYNRLTVIEPTSFRSCGSVMWLCLCECGNYTLAKKRDLENNRVTSCGCYHREVIKNSRK